jgi:hypothetical protein
MDAEHLLFLLGLPPTLRFIGAGVAGGGIIAVSS